MQSFVIVIGMLVLIISFIFFLATEDDNNLIGIPAGILILLLSLAAFNNDDDKNNTKSKESKGCNNNIPNIILPEEYKLIRETDTLKGYYDSEGTLHIEFNNKRNNQ